MKKDRNDMKAQYDLSGKKGVRGKYASAYKKGHTVRILNGEAVVDEKFFAAIDADVHAFFKDSKEINKALRGIISSVPERLRSASK
jgi:hypothetical protein